MTQTSDTIGHLLNDRGFSVTPSRRLVIEALADRDRLFTANDIVAWVEDRDPQIGRATVFRTLDLLVQLGVVSRIYDRDGNHRYITCEREHHHHLVCSRCGRVVSIDGCGLEETAQRIANQHGFTIDAHRVEYLGLCPDCQRAKEIDVRDHRPTISI